MNTDAAIQQINDRTAKVVVVGQGYVGLPVAMRAVEVGFMVVGFEASADRVKSLLAGESYVGDISDEELRRALHEGYVPTADPAGLEGFDVAVISVPTPLRDGMPDLSYIEQAGATLGAHLRPTDVGEGHVAGAGLRHDPAADAADGDLTRAGVDRHRVLLADQDPQVAGAPEQPRHRPAADLDRHAPVRALGHAERGRAEQPALGPQLDARRARGGDHADVAGARLDPEAPVGGHRERADGAYLLAGQQVEQDEPAVGRERERDQQHRGAGGTVHGQTPR